MPTTPPSTTPFPTVPDPDDRSTFEVRAYAWSAHQETARTELVALADNVYGNAVETVGLAAAAVTAKTAAEAAAAAAAASAGAEVWVSGTTYAVGVVRWSPSDFLPYRRRTAGGGTTDPSNDPANWAPQVTGGISNIVTATTDTTLTSTPTLLVITPATFGVTVTFPDATTMTETADAHAIDNRGDYPVRCVNNSGTLLGFVPPRAYSRVGLDDNSSAAGVWTVSGMQKVAIIAEKYVNGLTACGELWGQIELDSDRVCLLTYAGTNIYGIVYNSSTKTWGSAVLIRAAYYLQAIKSATNQILTVSCSTTTALEAMTLTITGETITPETATKATATLAGNVASFGLLTAVPAQSAWVLPYGRDTTTSALRAFTISGTTPTIGAERVLTAATTASAGVYISGSVVRTLNFVAATNLYCEPFTLTGISFAAGTIATSAMTGSEIRHHLNGNGNIVVHRVDTTAKATVFKLTGTTEAASTAATGVVFSTAAATELPITSGKALVVGANGTTIYTNILTDTAGTASAGTAINFEVIAGSVSTVHGLFASGTDGYIAYKSAAHHGLLKFDCSGASPVLTGYWATQYGTSTVMNEPGYRDTYNRRNPSCLVGSTHAYVCGGKFNNANLRYSVVGIDEYPILPVTGVGANVLTAADNVSWCYSAASGTAAFLVQKVEGAE